METLTVLERRKRKLIDFPKARSVSEFLDAYSAFREDLLEKEQAVLAGARLNRTRTRAVTFPSCRDFERSVTYEEVKSKSPSLMSWMDRCAIKCGFTDMEAARRHPHWDSKQLVLTSQGVVLDQSRPSFKSEFPAECKLKLPVADTEFSWININEDICVKQKEQTLISCIKARGDDASLFGVFQHCINRLFCCCQAEDPDLADILHAHDALREELIQREDAVFKAAVELIRGSQAASDPEANRNQLLEVAGSLAARLESMEIVQTRVPTQEGAEEEEQEEVQAKYSSLPDWRYDPNSGGDPIDFEDPFNLNEALLSDNTFRVRLKSLSSYLCKLHTESHSGQFHARAANRERLIRYCLVARILESGGHVDIPADLCIADSFSPMSPSNLRHGHVDVPEIIRSRTTASWRSLYAGSLVSPDPAICGQIGPVPPLGNVLTISSDIPVLVEKMLEQIPKAYWDTPQLIQPTPIHGFPNLCRGPGGLIPDCTPQQLARNALAAAILNRLCANFLGVATTGNAESESSIPKEAVVFGAKVEVEDIALSIDDAQQDANTTSRCWHEVWARVVPKNAHKEPLFGVRLTPTGSTAWSVKDFLQSLKAQPKHRLDAFFVRSAADSLMLCLREEKPWMEASDCYTHIPTPELVHSGLVDGNVGCDIRTARPQHCFRLKLEGRNFPFSVSFGAIGDSILGFSGYGLDALRYYTPWNPLEYGPMLREKDIDKSLSFLPVLACLNGLVNDRHLCIGPFLPLPVRSESVPISVTPLALVGLGLLQESLLNDCKIWPLQLPDLVRLRWEYAMKSLCYEMRHGADISRSANIHEFPEILSRCLEVLPRLPNDDGLGLTSNGNIGSLRYCLQRMEASRLTMPLHCVCRFQKKLENEEKLWKQFAVDTGEMELEI